MGRRDGIPKPPSTAPSGLARSCQAKSASHREPEAPNAAVHLRRTERDRSERGTASGETACYAVHGSWRAAAS
jgi:hypothetical protein